MRAVLAALPVLLFAAAGARAEAPMTAAEFEAYVAGKTLYYSNGGAPYGAEQYLSGRRVIWTFLDGDCAEGRWFASEGLICFVYEFDIAPQCWSFWQRSGGLAARFENDPEEIELYEADRSDAPLSCPGPEVGV